ncbi:hypothetical protein N7472_000069 [Penicillium cf. griseofulvum]|uniref:RING-type E3 ubiquitin transferase n=1 Tax=Penicillium cf. griseofulvum TaxID=2972120 RepID=A0A9W9T634_9EURO|nr:hypothetical protein N7472_000069 [Penicillium cf. griseofulvum]
MPGSSTASSSPTQSSPQLRAREGTRPVERPEGDGITQAASYSGYEGGSSRARVFPIRPGPERKRRLTSTGEDTRLQWGRPGGTAGPAPDNGGSSRSILPLRSVSMVLPSSRTRSSISAAPGSSLATAIGISSSPPGMPRSSTSGEQLPGLPQRENPTPWINQPRPATSVHNNLAQPVMDIALPKWQADSEVILSAPLSLLISAILRQCLPPTPPPVIDLTGDDHVLSSSLSTALNPALGGGEEGSSRNPEARQERRTVGANDRPRFLNELNSQPRQVPSANGVTRPRRSFSSREGNPPRRPALDEGDFCPVCRRQFPPLSPEQPLEARQAHTRACIEGYLTPTAPPSTPSMQHGPPLPHPPSAARMLPFVATEKDCLGEDGQTAECTICMEDYEVGQTLARLECLCKFHKHCIVDWFERKMECPVHKLS